MDLLSVGEQDKIVHAINIAENLTSGEIRVAVERACEGDVLTRATWYFKELGMGETALKNGVLIYVATEDHVFAIIGDKGINEKVPGDFWDQTKLAMLSHFKHDELVKGLQVGIARVATQLRAHFPRAEDDINELPNDIVFG